MDLLDILLGYVLIVLALGGLVALLVTLLGGSLERLAGLVILIAILSLALSFLGRPFGLHVPILGPQDLEGLARGTFDALRSLIFGAREIRLSSALARVPQVIQSFGLADLGQALNGALAVAAFWLGIISSLVQIYASAAKRELPAPILQVIERLRGKGTPC